MPGKHFDEAIAGSIAAVRSLLAEETSIERLVLIEDLFGKSRVVVWGDEGQADTHEQQISTALAEAAGPFWSGEVWHGPGKTEADRILFDRAWEEGQALDNRLRRLDRVRNRTAWFAPLGNPAWDAFGPEAGPPIVTFYSFKGGVGRTTALASFAIQRARAGERVAVIDLDLDAPGIGTLLAADREGTTARWGVVDYILEQAVGGVDLRDYYHACRRAAVTGSGEILVVPAGSLDPQRDYLGKLARLDLDRPGGAGAHVLGPLLNQVREALLPSWILIDARAGLSEPAGLALSGIAHLQVLFGTSSEQSWLGLQPVLDRLGASCVRANRPQLDCILVQAMVPADAAAGRLARTEFSGRALEEFSNHYYAPDPEDADDDRLWYLRDAEASDAPHVPAPISYESRLAHFSSIEEIADHLADSEELKQLADRIASRFAREEE